MTFLERTYDLSPDAPLPLAWSEYESRVIAAWRSLLVGDGRDDEAALQRFLEAHPSMVPGGRSFPVSGHLPLFSSVFTQPPLVGIGHRVPDFMWLAKDSNHLYPVVIEIETPAKRWFTAAGDPTAPLTHAVRQLSDWQAWFKDGGNHAVFRERFRIPDESWRRLTLHPQFVLVYGSRDEFENRDDLARRRGVFEESLAPDFFVMTFDRLAPDHSLDDTFCVRLSGDGLEAKTLSPALGLGPVIASDLSDLTGKDAAVDRTVWLSPERRAFLKSRFAYWEDWAAARHRGIMHTGDRE